MKVTFYVVRHGETLFNVQKKIQGICDSPLTEKGIRQVKEAREALKGVHFDAAYTSPAERAVDTSEILLEDYPFHAKELDDLHEYSFGGAEGENFEKDIGLLQRFEEMSWPEVGGESEQDVRGRIRRAFGYMVGQAKDEDRILVTTHGMYIQYIIDALFGMPRKEYREMCERENRHPIPNACIMEFCWENGEYKLLQYPAAGHDFHPSEEKRIIHFIYVRHGQTKFNVQNRMQGWCDSPLTDFGIRQAEDARDVLRNERIDRAYVSTSGRTRETAGILLDGRDIPVFTEKGIKEVNFGTFEGADRDRYKDEITRRHMTETWDDAGGENKEQVKKRLEETLARIVNESRNYDTVLLVSHGTLYLNILESIFGIDRRTYFETMIAAKRTPMPNAGIFRFRYENGEFKFDDYMEAPAEILRNRS